MVYTHAPHAGLMMDGGWMDGWMDPLSPTCVVCVLFILAPHPNPSMLDRPCTHALCTQILTHVRAHPTPRLVLRGGGLLGQQGGPHGLQRGHRPQRALLRPVPRLVRRRCVRFLVAVGWFRGTVAVVCVGNVCLSLSIPSTYTHTFSYPALLLFHTYIHTPQSQTQRRSAATW